MKNILIIPPFKVIAFTVLPSLLSCKLMSQEPEPVVLSYYEMPIHIEQSAPPPKPVQVSNGKWYASYHLLLSNRSHVDLELKQVEVIGSDGDVLLTFDQVDLEDYNKFRSTLIQGGDETSTTIKSGDTGMLMFWVIMKKDKVPLQFNHRFIFGYTPFIEIWNKPYIKGENIVFENYYVDIDSRTPFVFGAPLRGNRWKVGNGPGEYKTSHQYVLTSDGATRIPQRYGIDFQVVDEKNITLPTPLPKTLTNEMFYCYGQEILAVADGVVTGFKDGISENIPQDSGETITDYEMDASTVSGNYLTIKIGEGQFVHYAHLIPGSHRFKLGDSVKKGAVLGLLGNSGNSSGPHLHFNFTDGNSANGSNGLPYVFESFQTVRDEMMHHNEIPLNQLIINFNK